MAFSIEGCNNSSYISTSTPISKATGIDTIAPTLEPTLTVAPSPMPMYYWSHSLFTFTDMVIMPNSGIWIVDQRGLVVQNCMYEVSVECRYKNIIYSLDYYYGGITGIDFLTPDDGWVIGVPNSISHWNGTKWDIQKPADNKSGFSDIGFANPNNGWVVGSAGPEETNYTLKAIILHWNGSEWRDVSLLEEIGRNDFSLNAIDVVSEDNVWVVGDAVLNWNGVEWKEIPLPSYTQDLRGVSVISPNDVWVSGVGYVLHWDGSGWIKTQFDSYTDNVLAVSPNSVWVAGVALFHWNGKEWENAYFDEGTGNSIVKMEIAPDGAIWALTDIGNMYRLESK